MVRRNKTNYVIQSVAHALDVLEQFFGDVDELGVTELSKRLKLHKNNVFRLLATLEARGYIEQNKATENYRLGIKCLHLGRRYIDHMGLVRQARPILSDVAHSCRESTFVAIMRREGVVPLEAAEPEDRVVRITPPIGQTVAAALHGGRQGPSRLRPRGAVARRRCPSSFRAYTDRTIIDRAMLLEQLDAVARDGYSDGNVRVFRGCVLGCGADSRLHALRRRIAGRCRPGLSHRDRADQHGDRAADPRSRPRAVASPRLQRVAIDS